MIIFNTQKKAEHYIKYLHSLPHKDDEGLEMCIHNSWYISGRLVIHHHDSEVLCSASDPDNGYICCSHHDEYDTVIGIIKKQVVA